MGVCKAARRVLLLSPGPRVSKGPVGGNVAKLLNSTKRFCQQEWGKQDRNHGGLGLFLNHVVLKYVLFSVLGGSPFFLRLSIWSNTWPTMLEATISMAKVVHLQWTVPASCTHSWRSWGMSWEGMNPLVLLLLMDSGPGPCCIPLATWCPLNF